MYMEINPTKQRISYNSRRNHEVVLIAQVIVFICLYTYLCLYISLWSWIHQTDVTQICTGISYRYKSSTIAVTVALQVTNITSDDNIYLQLYRSIINSTYFP